MQCGGLLELQGIVDGAGAVSDVNGLLETALARFGTTAELPYSDIVKGIAGYQLRKRAAGPAKG